MKSILHFLDLQKAISEGLTQEQVSEKIEYLDRLEEQPGITENELYRKRRKIVDEINPWRKNQNKYKECLKYFAGKITPTDFTHKTFWKWKSEDKREQYLAEREIWEKERDKILEEFTVTEILMKVIEKEKQKIAEKKEKMDRERKILDENIVQLNAMNNMIMFSEEVENFDFDVIASKRDRAKTMKM
ncbi:hypothetical protein [Dickeya sp. DW 0440]|uniref:hypothetical protein n=1 Tax=Dickeya sp. DW 0440 TaxID=1225785 RepID=UPI0003A0200C|nr:hypothetical protein [Dickeya sp. DW 0440]